MSSVEDLRRESLERRARLTRAEVKDLSAKISSHFIQLLSRLEGEVKTIASYRVSERDSTAEADPSEVATHPSVANVLFAYPRVTDRFMRVMDFAPAIHESDWVKGAYGLFEPRSDLPGLPFGEIDVVIVPGVLFGEKGERVGRGGGYYDRILTKLGGVLRVGFAYDFQVSEKALPQQPWDERVDWVVTDRRMIETTGRAYA